MLFRGQKKKNCNGPPWTKNKVGIHYFWEKTFEYALWTKRKDLKMKFSCALTKKKRK